MIGFLCPLPSVKRTRAEWPLTNIYKSAKKHLAVRIFDWWLNSSL